MTEDQLRAFPQFQALPIVCESDLRSLSIFALHVKECCTLDEVRECLNDDCLLPLGALRASDDVHSQVVAYFGKRTSDT
ncbi:MAG: hypothetical protein ACJ8C4_14220 [Gemmataceae bacterium]